MVHYLDSNQKVWELAQREGLLLPKFKIGDIVTLKENWMDVYIDIMIERYFTNESDRTKSYLQPPDEIKELFQGGFKYIITNKFIAKKENVKNTWWSGMWPTHEQHEAHYFPDECLTSKHDIKTMYKPKKFIYESFEIFTKHSK